MMMPAVIIQLDANGCDWVRSDVICPPPIDTFQPELSKPKSLVKRDSALEDGSLLKADPNTCDPAINPAVHGFDIIAAPATPSIMSLPPKSAADGYARAEGIGKAFVTTSSVTLRYAIF